MKRKNTHINQKEFRRYLENRMTEAERNRFERELQKHPFEAEALEGYEKTSAEDLGKDIEDVKKRLRNSRSRRIPRYWVAAATILLLVLAGTTWFLIDRNPPSTEMAALESENPDEIISGTPDSVIEERAVSELAPAAARDNLKQPDEMQEMEEIAETRDPEPSDIELDEDIRNEGVISDNEAVASTTRDTPVSRYNPGTTRAAMVQSEAITQSLTENDEIGMAEKAAFQIEPDDVFPDSFRNIPAEERERIQEIQGVAVKDQVELESDVALNNVNAFPEGGMEGYIDYLENQAVLSEDYPERTDTVAFLLNISSEGEITNIQKQNDPDSVLFERLKEIVINGPTWNPEIANGERIRSEATFEIVFRKE